MTASKLLTPSAKLILDEAASWIEKRDRENWNAAEQAKLDIWLAQSPAHLVSFLRAENTWARADRLSALRTEPRPALALTRPPPPSRKGSWAAALFALVGGLAAAGIFLTTTNPSEKIYTTPVGGHSVLALADGSKVELNTNTSVRISIKGEQRLVKLERGEAFFDVKHDPAHPFVVLAANHRITDIGTKFVVRERGNGFVVSLVEGSAKLETAGIQHASGAAVLRKGDVAIATATGISVQRETSGRVNHALAWRRGVLMFDNTTLAEAAAEFNRYNAHKLIIADAAAARLSIAGTFHANDVQAFAEVAEDILHVHVRKTATETVISH